MRDREPFEDFRASLLERPGFEPWNLRVLTDDGGTVVGVSLVHIGARGVAYVARLAVRRDQRGGAWPRRCWWTASGWPASTGRASPS